MRNEQINELEHKLVKCITACETCATKCLDEDNVAEISDCIKLDRDCADICALTVRLLARKSTYAERVIKFCIESCRDCANECDRHAHQHCKDCARICRECLEACENYLGVAA